MAKGINLVKTSIVQSDRSAEEIIKETKILLEKALGQYQYTEHMTPMLNVLLQIITQSSLLALDAALQVTKTGEGEEGFEEAKEKTLDEIELITETVKKIVDNIVVNSDNTIKVATEDIQKLLARYMPRSR